MGGKAGGSTHLQRAPACNTSVAGTNSHLASPRLQWQSPHFLIWSERCISGRFGDSIVRAGSY